MLGVRRLLNIRKLSLDVNLLLPLFLETAIPSWIRVGFDHLILSWNAPESHIAIGHPRLLLADFFKIPIFKSCDPFEVHPLLLFVNSGISRIIKHLGFENLNFLHMFNYF